MPISLRFSAAVIPLLACTIVVHAQRDLKEIPPVDPNIEKASFKLAPGLEVNLFASEPMIHKPIQMAWDEKGRLWVATSAIYPHIKPGQEQTDKIVVLEDTDGDGTADKSTVFFEGLLIPTGILPGDGGAYVANSTELLFMKDTDGNGRADETKVLLSGFGTEDTHHILHGFKRGPDGCLYLMQSVYIHAHIETPFGVRRLAGSGIWQYRPETGRLEIFSMGHVNPWGHIFDQWGQSFTTDGAYGEGINYVFPGATFFCLPNQLPRILKGLNPGQPKQCGLEVISGRHFPDEWQGNLITNDFRGHRVNRFKVTDQGSGFASQQLEDVMASNHGSFRPIDVRMGPDGALYIADWFNPIIQHGEVDFRDERRDHTHGRIWRLSVKGRSLCPKVDFAKASDTDLIEMLKAPEQWVRLEAKQEWKRRDADGKGSGINSAFDSAEKRGKLISADPAHAVEIGWLLQSRIPRPPRKLMGFTDSLVPQGLGELLKHPDANVRAAAVRMARTAVLFGTFSPTEKDGFVVRATTLIDDENARVRLEAVNGLRVLATPKAAEVACKVLDHPMDENLDFALWLTCRELADVWLPAFQKGEITFGGNVAHIAFALKAADKPEASAALLKLLQDNKVAAGQRATVMRLLAQLGGQKEIDGLYQLSRRDQDTDAARAETVAAFEALTIAARQRRLKPSTLPDPGKAPATFGCLIAGVEEPRMIASTRLAGAWKIGYEVDLKLIELEARQQGNYSPELRYTAMQALAEIGTARTLGVLEDIARTANSPEARSEAVASLASLKPTAAAGEAASLLASLAEKTEPASRIFQAFLSTKGGPAVLAAALKDKKIPAAIATAGVQKASAAGGDTKALIDALTIAGGLQPVMALSAEQLSQMMADVKSSGDPARGELIYRRQNLLCLTCHAIGAVGGIVGPDMVSLGASAPVDYIIESLLEPSKKIKEGYATTMVTTKDNALHTGFLVREDPREVLLRDAAGKVESIPAASVAKKENIPVSLMPPLTTMLRRDELVDLVRFLSELGKEGAYKVQEDGTLRRWRTAQPVPEMWRWLNLKGNRGFAEAAGELTWLPVYARVDGTVHGSDATMIKVGPNDFCALQSEIEVASAGKVELKLNDASGLDVFINGLPVPAQPEISMDLPAGKSTITLVFDAKVRTAPIKVQIASPANSKPVKGV